jgi:protein transport protein SEC31
VSFCFHFQVFRKANDLYSAAGDRSHIPPTSMPVFEILNNEMQRIKSRAPANYRAQVVDTEKRIGILFDHLNNQVALKPDTIEEVKSIAQAIQSRQHDQATVQLTEMMTTKTDEGSNWMVSFYRFNIDSD